MICFLKLLITYADFSGYSDIAIGSARLFGIKIMENFNYPLLRSNLTDFWKNWHISLSSWVKDYIYYPLLIKYKILWLAIIATMVIMGLWHQGNFNWFSWGLHHSLGLIIYSAIRKYFSNKSINFKFNSNKIIKQAHYLTGVLTVWWFVSLAYALTMFPDDFSRSFKLYIKILSFGVINA